MAEKTSVKLNIGERFTLLSLLQNFNDFATYKIIQKLKMTLAPDEKEIKAYEFENKYRCPRVKYDEDGQGIQCEYEEFGKVAPKCPVHSTEKKPIFCVPTGFMRWNSGMATVEKEIWFGPKAKSLIVETLTKLNDEKKLTTDMDISLYIKFVKSEKEEDEEED